MHFFDHMVQCTGANGMRSFGLGYSETEALRALLFHAESNFNIDTLQAYRVNGDREIIGQFDDINSDPDIRAEWVEQVAEQLASEAATLRESLLQRKGGQ